MVAQHPCTLNRMGWWTWLNAKLFIQVLFSYHNISQVMSEHEFNLYRTYAPLGIVQFLKETKLKIILFKRLNLKIIPFEGQKSKIIPIWKANAKNHSIQRYELRIMPFDGNKFKIILFEGQTITINKFERDQLKN